MIQFVLDFAESSAQEAGALGVKLTLLVKKDNMPAKTLYSRCGFKVVGTFNDPFRSKKEDEAMDDGDNSEAGYSMEWCKDFRREPDFV